MKNLSLRDKEKQQQDSEGNDNLLSSAVLLNTLRLSVVKKNIKYG